MSFSGWFLLFFICFLFDNYFLLRDVLLPSTVRTPVLLCVRASAVGACKPSALLNNHSRSIYS
jgi:hypothetical protein